MDLRVALVQESWVDQRKLVSHYFGVSKFTRLLIGI